MAIQLVVTHPFGPFAKGEHITDPALVAKWGASHPEYVVRKALDDAALAEFAAAKAKAEAVAE